MVQAITLAKDLLEQANHLARRERKVPKQASLRRAVSTAYYALFYLLIGEAVSNWNRSDQRARLARAFEHGRMKEASKKVVNGSFQGQNPQTVAHLKTVAGAFSRLQDLRHKADYDTTFELTRTDANAQIDLASVAFTSWSAVRKERIAQDYLVSLLLPDKRR